MNSNHQSSNSETQAENTKPMVSIVIPAFNEIHTIEEVFRRVTAVFRDWDRNHEIIFIDDGSSDGTRELIRSFPGRAVGVKSILMARNFGQQAAVAAGFEKAQGEYIIAMDSDLQVDPIDIPRLAEKMDEGYDIVAGYRETRLEGFWTRKLPSLLVNKFFNVFFKLPYRDMGCGLQAFRKTILEGIDPFSAMYAHRAIYAVWRGGRFADIPITYRERQAGTTKYSIADLIFFFLDIILTFLRMPIQLVFFFLLGSFLLGVGGLSTLITIIMTLTSGLPSSGLWSFNLFVVFSGLIIITFGLINERINRIDHRVQKTPIFVIESIIEHGSIKTNNEE